MYDRRIDGKVVLFGNASSLYMSAMTWWDHDTESIWSQPWGRAIQGELKGTALFILPTQITTWGSWKMQHPETLIMTDDIELMPNLRQTFQPEFIIGITIAEQSKGYRFADAATQTIINDTISNIPVLIYATADSYHAYIRETETHTLTFRVENGRVVDIETNSTWDIVRGLATSGELRGQSLQSLPSMSAFEDHWLDFYPNSTFWEGTANNE